MLEIDCRICKNLGNDECKLYGRDPDVAGKKCAENGFKDYKPSWIAKMIKWRNRK